MNLTESFSFMIAEDESRIRKNLIRKILEQDGRFRLAGEGSNGEEVLAMMDREPPDVLFTDIRMPVMDGLRLIEETYFRFPEVMLVIISGYNDFEYARKGIQFGVLDYLLKPLEPAHLKVLLEKLAARLETRYELREGECGSGCTGLAQEGLALAAADYIREHYVQDLSVFSLAERFHANPTYLTRIFKQYLEKTPTRFIADLRLGQARHLMKTRPDMGIKEISWAVGYADQGYFSRIFRKTTGESPSEYKDRVHREALTE